MARSKLPEDTVIQLLQCQRWGVCEAGTADICAVDLKTVSRFQRVAAQWAVTHPQQSVQNLEVQGVQLDEAHTKLRPKQVAWVHTALAMGSFRKSLNQFYSPRFSTRLLAWAVFMLFNPPSAFRNWRRHSW
jgi:hypothetical protein